jgi:hypothetical protein
MMVAWPQIVVGVELGGVDLRSANAVTRIEASQW